MSEQDFFFDEEQESAPDQPKAKASRAASDDVPAKRPATAKAKQPAAEPVVSSYEPQVTTWTIAILLALVGLLLGAILGFFLGSALGKPAPAVSGTPTTPVTQTPSSGTPSTLTSDQINAGLPAGHPAINTSSTETTAK